MERNHEIRIGPAGWSCPDWEGIVCPSPRPCDLLDLLHLLGRPKVRVPEPLREHYPRLEKIADEPAMPGTLFPPR